MKNTLTNLSKLLSIILLVSFVIISCKSDDTKEIKDECGSDPAAREAMSKQIISNNEVFTYYENYSNSRSDILKEPLANLYGSEFNDTRTVTFDFKVLKEYLKYIEEVSERYGTTPEGIKIGFGVYPSDNKDYPNKTNIFFTPTTSNNGRQSAYTVANNKIVFFKDLLQKNTGEKVQKGGFILFDQDGDSGLGISGGRPIPPPSSGDTDFQ